MATKKAVVNKKSKPKTTVSKALKTTKKAKKTTKKIETKVVKKTTKKTETKKATKKIARKTAEKKTKKIADRLADKLKLFDVKTTVKKTITSKPKDKIKERAQHLTFTTDLFSYQELKNTKEETTLTKYDIGAHTTSVEYAYDPMKTEELSPLYYIDRVVMLPIDPKFAFTYWEVKEDTLNHFFQMHG